MTTGYYLEDHPNPNTPQYGWLRARIWEAGQHLSGAIGVHTSEAITDFEGVDNNAENNAAFLARRTDHGSYHTTGDADSIVRLLHPRWAAWADITNNKHALSVSGCLQAARWLEMTPARRAAVVRNMAYAAAEMVLTAVRDGYLAAVVPARRISAAEAINGTRAGFYGHGETNPGTRYDPGSHFDWDLFLASYAAAVGGGVNYQGTTEEDEMSAADIQYLKDKAARSEQLLLSLQDAITDPVSGYIGKAAKLILSNGNQTLYIKGNLESDQTVYAHDIDSGDLRSITLPEWEVVHAAGGRVVKMEQEKIDRMLVLQAEREKAEREKEEAEQA